MLIGIDWADDHHDALFMDCAGNHITGFRFGNDEAGFSYLHGQIASHVPCASEAVVAIETKHGLLVHDLLRHGYQVYAIPPKAANRYKDRHRSADTKSDSLDAISLADLLRTDRHLHKLLILAPEDYRLIGQLSNDLRTLVDDSTRISNRILACLKDYHPIAIGAFTLTSGINMAFLREYPTPQKLVEVTKEQFVKFTKDRHYSSPSKVAEIYAHIKQKAPNVNSVSLSAGQMKLRALVDQLEVTHANIKVYERQIAQLLEKLPEADIISSLPGVGKRITPEITAMLGPNLKDAPKRFEEANQMVRLSGCAPVTKQSGKWKAVDFRYACDKTMRRTVRDWAAASINFCPWAKAFYNYHAKQLERHETILRKLAAKWIKIAYRLWSTGERYDEQKHVNALKQHKVVWAASL